MSETAFKPDEFSDALVSFRGIVSRIEYDTDWVYAGSPFDRERGKRLRMEIVTEEFKKPQYEWLTPTKSKGTKWEMFIKAMEASGANKDITVRGLTDDEKRVNWANQLLGMDCQWDRKMFASPFKKKQEEKELRLTVPVKYFGRVAEEMIPKPEMGITEEEIPAEPEETAVPGGIE